MEEAVLGAVMLESDAVITVVDLLRQECFYKEAHRKIFNAVRSLNSKEIPVDLYTITEELKATGDLDSVGGPVYLAQLTSKVVSAANVEYHAKIVAQKYIQRELIRVSTDIQAMAYDDTFDITDLLDRSENDLFQIAEGNIKREVLQINVVIERALREMEEAGKQEDGLIGVPSGFSKLDRLTSGWQKSDLIIIAARPSMGKTAFALSMARNMAIEHHRKVAIFSLEMASVQLVNRLITAETELPGDKIKNGRLTEAEWRLLGKRIKSLEEAPIYIDDTPAISVFELRAKCRRLKAHDRLDVAIVDYLQLMSGPPEAGNREQEVSLISRSLKSIAKELNIPILALSQLNRSVETRGGSKRPQLSDLRESGAIEQDADMVIFIHRQEKYGLLEFEDGTLTKGIAEIILSKNRNGPVGDVRLRFRDERAQFTELDEFELDEITDSNTGRSQSYTVGSKMNNDDLARRNKPVIPEQDDHDEPPFS
jgi:replicative DNA helicase